MKFNYCFSLAMILIILFSLTTVMASENITDGTACLDEDLTLAITGEDCADEDLNEIDESQNILNQEGESTDLSVKIDFDNVYEGDEFNKPGCELPLNVTAKVSSGTAYKTKIYITLSDNMKYVSHDKTLGTFNPETGIWDIGDLSGSDTALLIITTKLLSGERFIITANGTCDPPDANLKNNHKSLAIRSGAKKIGSNTTETTADTTGSDKGDHEKSLASTGFVETEHETDKSKTQTTKNEKSKSETSEKGSDSKNDASNQKNEQSATKSSIKTTSNIYKSVENSIKNIMGQTSKPTDEDSGEESDLGSALAEHVSAIIPEYDYKRIPFIMFVLFLVVLVATVGYDKIKS